MSSDSRCKVQTNLQPNSLSIWTMEEMDDHVCPQPDASSPFLIFSPKEKPNQFLDLLTFFDEPKFLDVEPDEPVKIFFDK